MNPGVLQRRPALVLALAITAILYFTAAKLGLKVAFQHPSATPVWPPTGIALAALVLLGYRLWPAIFIGAFFANVTTAGSIATSLGIAMGNTIEAVLGTFLINRFGQGRDAFDRPETILRWMLHCATLSTLVSAVIGVSSLTLGGYAPLADFWSIGLTWWLGDAGGALIVAPFLILWARNSRLAWSVRQCAEAALLGATLLTLSVLVFGVPFRVSPRTYPLPFALPLLAWVGFRLGQRATATAVLALSALAIWGTMEGQGSFAAHSQAESLLFLQIFLAVSSATALAVAASVRLRKEVEASLALLAEAVESSDDAIIVMDLDGKILRWNRAAERLYGYAEDQVKSRPITLIIPEDRHEEEREILTRLARGERIQHLETIRRRQDGSLLDVSLTISPVKDRSGRIIGASKMARDVTDKKRAQEEIVRLNADLEDRVRERTARLEAAIRELETFTYSVAHDLRAPLRGIHQFCDLLLEEKAERVDEQGKEWMRLVADSAHRMDVLIENLLAYSRIGREQMDLSIVELSELIAEILSHMKGELEERHAKIEVETGLPRVRANRVLLTQVLTNLFSNAVKFVPPTRTPAVRVSSVRSGDRVRLLIEDNGIGIDPRHRDRIFRIFERLHGREDYPGTGIGLAIVKKAVEQMGGIVGFEPIDSRGTCFYIELPKGTEEPRIDQG